MKKYRIWAQLIVDGDIKDRVDYDTDCIELLDVWEEFGGSLKAIKQAVQCSNKNTPLTNKEAKE